MLTRIWGRRGSRPRAVRGSPLYFGLPFGTICPARGTGAAVITPYVNVEAINEQGNRIWNCVRLIEAFARRGGDGFYPGG
jgi:hypothetical protein